MKKLDKKKIELVKKYNKYPASKLDYLSNFISSIPVNMLKKISLENFYIFSTKFDKYRDYLPIIKEIILRYISEKRILYSEKKVLKNIFEDYLERTPFKLFQVINLLDIFAEYLIFTNLLYKN